MNMKKEMVYSKQEELNRSRRSLIELRNELDTLHSAGELKSRELSELMNKTSQLRDVAAANVEKGK